MAGPRHSRSWIAGVDPVPGIAALPVVAHLLTAANYGIFRDEYYYLACARHLAWGYVDHPPLSIALLALFRAAFGEGLTTLRAVPALCGAAVIVLSARIATGLGGGAFARTLAATATAVAGVVQVVSGFYSMNALDLVFWAAAWALLVAWVADPAPRRMIELGILLGFGLLNKIGLFVLGAALALALPFTRLRREIRKPAPYLGAGLSLLLFAPHVGWQILHGWPTLEFIENARRYKISHLAPHRFFGEIVLEQQPANLLVWGAGLVWLLFALRGRPFRPLGFVVVVAFALLLLQGAKPYYAAGLFPLLFAAGACAWEDFTASGRRARLRPAFVALLATCGLFFLPLALPVLPPEKLARWQRATGIAPAAAEVGHTSELPQHYSDRFGWEELAAEVARVVEGLEAEERARVVVIAQNYGEAGALDYWRKRYGLPPVVSGHNSYAFWSPAELPLDPVVVVGWREPEVRESFGSVERAGTLEHPWALEAGLPIWIAREPRLPWSVLRERIRFYI